MKSAVVGDVGEGVDCPLVPERRGAPTAPTAMPPASAAPKPRNSPRVIFAMGPPVAGTLYFKL